MSEIDPNLPPPPPSPEGWVTPPPYMPAYVPASPRPAFARWVAIVTFVATILAAGGGLGIGLTAARYLHTLHPTQSAAVPNATQPSTPTAPISAATPSANQNGTIDVQAIAARVDPAIVDINTVIQTSSGTGAAAGTGMIITPSGEVLTNNHVVDGSISISVIVAGHAGSYRAHVIGVSPTADVALIQIEGVSGLPTVTLADSSNLKVGDQVVALGNALGAGGTPSVTRGQITAIDQTITASEGNGRAETLTGMIQSDATISPGDSGGALVNSAGQVIGMITAGESQGFRQTTSTVGYAIPTNNAIDVVNQIRAGGKGNPDIIMGQPGYLGVSVQPLTASVAAGLGLSVGSGVVVTQVMPGSPAEHAGIAQDSVITTIEGNSVGSQNALSQAIQSHKPGQQIRVGWVDQSGSHSATVTLASGANA